MAESSGTKQKGREIQCPKRRSFGLIRCVMSKILIRLLDVLCNATCVGWFVVCTGELRNAVELESVLIQQDSDVITSVNERVTNYTKTGATVHMQVVSTRRTVPKVGRWFPSQKPTVVETKLHLFG